MDQLEEYYLARFTESIAKEKEILTNAENADSVRRQNVLLGYVIEKRLTEDKGFGHTDFYKGITLNSDFILCEGEEKGLLSKIFPKKKVLSIKGKPDERTVEGVLPLYKEITVYGREYINPVTEIFDIITSITVFRGKVSPHYSALMSEEEKKEMKKLSLNPVSNITGLSDFSSIYRSRTKDGNDKGKNIR